MAIVYNGKAPANAKLFRVGVDTPQRSGYQNVDVSPPVNEYKPWQSPTSNNSGEQFFTKYDKDKDTNYLYNATYTTRPTTADERGDEVVNGQYMGGGGTVLGQPNNRGMYRGYDYVQEVSYSQVGPAPGANPEGSRQPERAKKRSSDADTSSGGGTYAKDPKRAGNKGTILTGARGLLGSSGADGTKTLLGK